MSFLHAKPMAPTLAGNHPNNGRLPVGCPPGGRFSRRSGLLFARRAFLRGHRGETREQFGQRQRETGQHVPPSRAWVSSRVAAGASGRVDFRVRLRGSIIQTSRTPARKYSRSLRSISSGRVILAENLDRQVGEQVGDGFGRKHTAGSLSQQKKDTSGIRTSPFSNRTVPSARRACRDHFVGKHSPDLRSRPVRRSSIR